MISTDCSNQLKIRVRRRRRRAAAPLPHADAACTDSRPRNRETVEVIAPRTGTVCAIRNPYLCIPLPVSSHVRSAEEVTAAAAAASSRLAWFEKQNAAMQLRLREEQQLVNQQLNVAQSLAEALEAVDSRHPQLRSAAVRASLVRLQECMGELRAGGWAKASTRLQDMTHSPVTSHAGHASQKRLRHLRAVPHLFGRLSRRSHCCWGKRRRQRWSRRRGSYSLRQDGAASAGCWGGSAGACASGAKTRCG